MIKPTPRVDELVDNKLDNGTTNVEFETIQTPGAVSDTVLFEAEK